MTEAQLIQNYVRVRVTPARIMIEVRVEGLEDEEGSVPFSRWALAAALPKLSLAPAVERARMMAVADRRYFRTCDGCGGRLPVAQIISHDDGTEHCRDCDGEAGRDD